MTTREAVVADAEEIARIYNKGIEDGVETFETRLRSAAGTGKWFDGSHPAVMVEEGGRIIAFAATSGYRPRDCYAGNRGGVIVRGAGIAEKGRGAGSRIRRIRRRRPEVPLLLYLQSRVPSP